MIGKLVIQIPCFNEEAVLADTLAKLPRDLPGVGRVEWLVISDGSTDRTVEVAQAAGADHILELKPNQGLARAFTAGLEAALEVGADVIVNTDADDQYEAADIPALIAPILAGEADIVVGDRGAMNSPHFSALKRRLQGIGSWVVRAASGTDIPDAPSGFRALNREAAMEMNVFNSFTYTLEMIIQAGHKNLRITHVPVRTNPATRPSRLFSSNANYILRSGLVILKIFMIYQPLRFFMLLAAIPFSLGTLLGLRWIALFFIEEAGRSRVPSLVLTAILLLMGFGFFTLGLVAEYQSVNRHLLEDIQYQERRRRYGGGRRRLTSRSDAAGEETGSPARPAKEGGGANIARLG